MSVALVELSGAYRYETLAGVAFALEE